MAELVYNPDTGEARVLQDNEWVPTQVYENPETGERIAYDGTEWRNLLSKPQEPAMDAATLGRLEAGDELENTPPTEEEKQQPQVQLPSIQPLPTGEGFFARRARIDEQKAVARGRAGQPLLKVIKETALGIPNLFASGIQIGFPEIYKAIEESQVGQFFSSVDKALEPNLDDDQKIMAELTSYLTLGAAGKKLLEHGVEYLAKRKGKQKAEELANQIAEATGTPPVKIVPTKDIPLSPKQAGYVSKAGLLGGGLGAVQATVQFSDEEYESLINMASSSDLVRNNLPEPAIKALDALKINPEDSEAKRKLKIYANEILTIGLATGLLKSAVGVGRAGFGVVQGSEKIAKLNTGLGRLFSSNAALPRELAEAAIQRSGAAKGYEIEIKKSLKDLQRLQKSEKVSDDALSDAINKNDMSGVTTPVRNAIVKLKGQIKANEADINSMLGLTGKNRIGLSFGPEGIYFTRSFEAANNPQYYTKIKNALDNKNPDPVFVSKVDNARQYFISKGVKPQDVDGLIEEVVSKLSKKDTSIIGGIFDGLGSKAKSASASAAVKILKKRKDLDKPVLELLSEISEPYQKLSTTLLNQNKLISEIKFLKDVENFAKDNVGKDVELPGLFKSLPSAKTTFSVQSYGGVDRKLEEIAQQSIGKFGGNSKKILADLYAEPTMIKYIGEGLDIFSQNGKSTQDFLGKAASLGQATQTILDLPAYLLNLWGGVQGLISNGHLLRPSAYKDAVTGVKTLSNQLTLKDKKAVEEIAMLRRLGVLEQDVTGEMIGRNANLYGDNAKNAFTKVYGKTMKNLGSAYGQPDAYTKLIAYRSELSSLKKIFPNMSEKELQETAARYVRDTMPTYGVASPAAKLVSRVPVFGNYPLFPAEVLRTHKNIVKYAARDIIEGAKNRNAKQIVAGGRRLLGLGATTAGVEAAVNTNNDKLNISENNKKVMNILAPDWAKGSQNMYLEPFVKDETGEGLTPEQKKVFKPYIRTRYVGSTSADAMDYIKAPVRLVMGKLLGTGSISESEIDNAFSNAAKSLTSPFVSPKLAATALFNAASGVDLETGKPLTDQAVGARTADQVKESVLNFLSKVEPGTSKAVRDYIEATNSEELLGEGNGQRASGFPLNSNDLKLLFGSGIRSVTTNVEKAIGYDLSKDLKAIAQTKPNFINEVTRLPYEKLTDEKINELVQTYKDLQERKYRGMQNLTKKVNEFKNIGYIRRYKDGKGNIQQEKKELEIEGVLAAASDDFWYKGDKSLIAPLIADVGKSSENGIFIPDQIFDKNSQKKLFKAAIDRGFDGQQYDKLINGVMSVYEEYSKKPLVEKQGN